MQPHPYDVLTLDNGAKLIFTPCPGTKDEAVSASVATLKAAGTKMLVTLMFDDEIVRNAAEYLPAECTKQAITWVQLPIADDAAPRQEFETQWLAHKTQIIELLNNQGIIAVHCKGGSGRTGLVIGLILVSLGWPKDKVINAVQALRPKALVHPVQREYFDAFNG
ncbi:tyrosine-protein phosphatase [Shewanella sp. SR44-4]|uniref:phosphatase domain-containing putative toxin n=1 Tax=Shewanella sp. SR44-4 TaxID=2760935 RepID=UPI001601C561|nr:tyrosine-protein phosphatase [Shewanella sp. SR44-4]MBB1364116.1 tyrosine-protein phosphatase [Shewanella sp. SR44-4]